jgi:hypothetical protein
MRRDSRPRKSTRKTEVPKPRMTTEARFFSRFITQKEDGLFADEEH